MNRAEKETFVGQLTKDIMAAKAFALMSFSKLNADQMTSFRLRLRRNNVRVKVLKNTLAKMVLERTPYRDMIPQLDGPTLIALGMGDPIITTQLVCEWADKQNFNLKIRGGMALGQILSDTQLKRLSKLPGRNELLVSFLWAANHHPTRFLYAGCDMPRRLGYALGALKTKRGFSDLISGG